MSGVEKFARVEEIRDGPIMRWGLFVGGKLLDRYGGPLTAGQDADTINAAADLLVKKSVERERKEKEMAYRLIQNCCLDKGNNERFWHEVEGWLDQKILPECYPPNSSRRFPTDIAILSARDQAFEECAAIAETEWMRGKNSIVRGQELVSKLGERIASAIHQRKSK